ncbi:radical SAM family heme chaperone HemW [Thermosynechococcus sp. HN-54]|uniref:radical SAM family heme chaperone HemW n=1 Tax=Thermosynechococcus sp. HN-54 TaxID=2933959 RepID=UPI00202CF8B1|nr:radical SAM family heme chaperone HemW [Thermosynechococcus sp. HN-54]URR35627.1 radical SAM family heme chaperone HemW [Thermosynechococcus sp. HN-54]
MTTAAYIHLPFCRRRCFYCDFPITVVGDSPTLAESLIQEYVAALRQEIAHTPAEPLPLQTIFFGGGTPSLVPPQYIGQLLEALDRQIGIILGAEISMEMDPGTFDLEQLQGYLRVGVNRVSLGVQAFDNELLRVCGRSHDVADVERAVEMIHRAGVENWSIDLISGLPQQSLADWQFSLEQAIALNPKHLSIYDLIIEPKTVFSKRYQPEAAPLPTQEQAATAYCLGHEMLSAAGYDHYEISNYARPGFRCRHNQVYWHNQPYYGFGMGATSYLRHRRLSRPRTRREYYQWLQSLPESLNQVSPDSLWDRWLETLMLGLRLRDGLSLVALADEFPTSWVEALQRVAAKMSPETLSLAGDRLHLTQPAGFLMANTVIVTLWEEMERSVFHQQQGQSLPIH